MQYSVPLMFGPSDSPTQHMAEIQQLTITSCDQHRFEAKLHASDDAHSPLLIFLSAMGTPARVYGRFAREMALHGVQVCTADWRGIGSSSMQAGRNCDWGYRHLVEHDLAALLAALRERYPDTPIWLGGHSLGGQLSLLGAAANPAEVSGVLLVASGTVHLPCYSPAFRWRVRTLALISRITGALLGHFPGKRLGFAAREASSVMRDWSHVARSGKYQPHGTSLNYEGAMRALKLPVLALNFKADLWSPLAATQALLGKVPATRSVHWNWSKAETGDLEFDHFSWTKQPTVIAPALAQQICHMT